MSSPDPRWQAVIDRDHAADGAFVYAVETTGIYCRPTCPSRRPLRKNVRFHPDADAAEAAGFRPCRRCNPRRPPLLRQQADVIARLCAMIDRKGAPVRLEDLAKAAGWSPSHTHRTFKRHTGLTPLGYARASQKRALEDALNAADSVTDAAFRAGFTSTGHFHQTAKALLGMTPSDFRAGAAGHSVRYAFGEASLGLVLVAATQRGICSVLIGEHEGPLLEDLHRRFARAQISPATEDFSAVVKQVVALIENPAETSRLPLDIQGTAFQRKVWETLRQIPAGKTATYKQVAEAIGAPRSSRAVAQACAANKIAVAIPCHRVIRGDGGLSGYRWGIARKRTLLQREGALPPDDS
ncbi:MAG: bifunctional DNA-binding transcriptional regulator/O6-methylguanine-DNA methyltransferase Ada [Myxococcota bacterium]